ncbi:hypothetical protein EV363DRAFT_1329552 [Boletus edulis]|nr:hypothetical protein EV363DRAFT_1329552 [Boletus edulis]
MSLHHMDHTTMSPTSGGVTVNECKWLMGGVPCGQGFATFDGLILHLGREHDMQGSAERKLVCQWWKHTGSCGNQYRRDAYRRHIATHLSISFPCNATGCNKSFSRVDSLRSHVKKKHTKG